MRSRINNIALPSLPNLPGLPSVPSVALKAGIAGAVMMVLLYQLHQLGNEGQMSAECKTGNDEMTTYTTGPAKRNGILRAVGNTIKGLGFFAMSTGGAISMAGGRLAGDVTATKSNRPQ